MGPSQELHALHEAPAVVEVLMQISSRSISAAECVLPIGP